MSEIPVTELVDRCNLTVHLAAAVGVRLIVEKPVQTIETNVRGTEVVLAAAAKEQKLVVLASTSEVYGKSSKIPFTEDDDFSSVRRGIRGGRTRARRRSTNGWRSLTGAKRHVPVIIVRFFNTVGPRQTGRYGMVLPNFAGQALRGEPIQVFGTGKQSRCFGHVRESVEAVLRLIETPAAIGEVVNLGSDREVTIGRLAEMVREIVDSPSDIVHVPYDEAYAEGFEDLERRVPDVRKLEQLTGFRFSIPLEQIIEDVVEDQRRRLAADRHRFSHAAGSQSQLSKQRLQS